MRHRRDHRDIRTPVEELHRGKGEDPIVFDNDQEPVRRKTHPIGTLEVERWRECLHLERHVVFVWVFIAAVGVGHDPHRGLARADEQHIARWRHGHVTRMGHHRIQLDLEPGW